MVVHKAAKKAAVSFPLSCVSHTPVHPLHSFLFTQAGSQKTAKASKAFDDPRIWLVLNKRNKLDNGIVERPFICLLITHFLS